MTKELIKKNKSNEYVEGRGQEKAFSHGKSWVSEKRYCDTNNETTGRYSGNNGFSTRKQRWYSSRKHQTGPSNLVYKDVQASHLHHHPPCFPFILCILAFTSSLKFEALSSFSFFFLLIVLWHCWHCPKVKSRCLFAYCIFYYQFLIHMLQDFILMTQTHYMFVYNI